MTNEVHSYKATYRHPETGETVSAIVHGRSLREATAKALQNNVPAIGESFYWELISVNLIEE